MFSVPCSACLFILIYNDFNLILRLIHLMSTSLHGRHNNAERRGEKRTRKMREGKNGSHPPIFPFFPFNTYHAG